VWVAVQKESCRCKGKKCKEMEGKEEGRKHGCFGREREREGVSE
jgi:hypothetical protein